MSKETFVRKNFGRDALAVIDKANEIISDYQAQGFTLTLRQLYYQFVARALLPNTLQSYKRLGNIINDGRLAGMIDWLAIEDRVRNLQKPTTWNSPRDIIDACADQYKIDKWADQPTRVEVWVEKDALTGVIEPACDAYDVPYFACRGYTSQSEEWRAAKRFQKYERSGQEIVVFYLGDHDPSGLDMTRDHIDRLRLLSWDAPIAVKRLALNMDQVRQYNPPENFAKITDSRASEYIKRYGDKSWELDALDPTVIDALIRNAIEGVLRRDAWDVSVTKETTQRNKLQAVADNWTD